MPDVVLDQIQGDGIDKVWPLLAEQFERALRKYPTPLTLDDLRAGFDEQRVALWAIYERDKPIPLLAAAATCLRQATESEILVIAGRQPGEWLKPVLAEFESLAWANGVTRISCWGRRGWSRLMPDYRVTAESGRKYLMEKSYAR